MAFKYYEHPDDCEVQRNQTDYPDRAVLINCDGDVIFNVPENWTDEQIISALRFANTTHHKGYEIGRMEKAQEIRKAINCD